MTEEGLLHRISDGLVLIVRNGSIKSVRIIGESRIRIPIRNKIGEDRSPIDQIRGSFDPVGSVCHTPRLEPEFGCVVIERAKPRG